MVGALSDPFDDCHMGVTAENVAKQVEHLARGPGQAGRARATSARPRRSPRGTSRSRSCRSRSRARAARSPSRPTSTSAATARWRGWPGCKPVFDKSGTVTAGNASSINDAAAAVVLMEREAGRAAGPEAAGPAGRLHLRRRRARSTWASARCRRCRAVLEKTGLKVNDIDVFEVNEAFAAQALAVVRDLELPRGPHQPERQRHLARPPDRRDRLHPDHQGALRAEAHRRPPRAGHDVHRRRPGHRRHLRARRLRPSGAVGRGLWTARRSQFPRWGSLRRPGAAGSPGGAATAAGPPRTRRPRRR